MNSKGFQEMEEKGDLMLLLPGLSQPKGVR